MALHLIWTIPVAALLSIPPLVLIQLGWCGVSGCSGGGFGLTSGIEWGVVLLGAGAIALAWLLAVLLPPWLRPGGVRAGIAVAVALVAALALTAVATDGFTHAERPAAASPGVRTPT